MGRAIDCPPAPAASSDTSRHDANNSTNESYAGLDRASEAPPTPAARHQSNEAAFLSSNEQAAFLAAAAVPDSNNSSIESYAGLARAYEAPPNPAESNEAAGFTSNEQLSSNEHAAYLAAAAVPGSNPFPPFSLVVSTAAGEVLSHCRGTNRFSNLHTYHQACIYFKELERLGEPFDIPGYINSGQFLNYVGQYTSSAAFHEDLHPYPAYENLKPLPFSNNTIKSFVSSRTRRATSAKTKKRLKGISDQDFYAELDRQRERSEKIGSRNSHNRRREKVSTCIPFSNKSHSYDIFLNQIYSTSGERSSLWASLVASNTFQYRTIAFQ